MAHWPYGDTLVEWRDSFPFWGNSRISEMEDMACHRKSWVTCSLLKKVKNVCCVRASNDFSEGVSFNKNGERLI